MSTTVRVATTVEGPTLVAVTLWRLLLAGTAWATVAAAVLGGGLVSLAYFTQVSALLIALAATASLLTPLLLGGAMETRWGVLRGAATCYGCVTLLVFARLLGADYSQTVSLLAHLLLPVAALVDWLLVGRNQPLAWWWPLVWLVVPLLYLLVYLLRGETLYPILDPGSANFDDWIMVMLAYFLIVGYAVWGLGRLRGLRWPPHRVPSAEALRSRWARRR